MTGRVDLHCHCVPGIDDGVKTAAEGRELLSGLAALGFDLVIATPHMRPGLFDNDKADIEQAFGHMLPHFRRADQSPEVGLPRVELASEHYFDDVVYARLLAGQGLPYPGGHAVLIELWDIDMPQRLEPQLARLSRQGLVPVIAHPERYRATWEAPESLERLLDVGAVALLDTAAVVGAYGKRAERAAHELLEAGWYSAACSDSHRPTDLANVARGIAWIETQYGSATVAELFVDGPRRILEGRHNA